MATYPLSTLAATVTSAGITAPAYSDIYASLQASFQAIYGTAAVIDPSSQDGQLLAIVAQAISDTNNAAIAAFNNYSPATALGAGLSSVVKINGIARNTASNSQVNLTITGVVGTTIVNGIAQDVNGNQWALPASVTIPSAGYIVVTATCTVVGAIAAAVGSVTSIATPQLGWQSVTNTSVASQGAPVELDAALRVRQATSTAQASQTVLAGILGAVLAVPGVTQATIYENDTDTTNGNGQNPHSIAVMAIGGSATAIANAILMRKTPGAYTFGSTSVSVYDPTNGLPYTIRYTVPAQTTVTAAITIKQLTGYTSTVGVAIQTALMNYINATQIGGGAVGVVEWDGAIVAVKSVAGNATFKIVSLVLSGTGGAGSPDVPIAFNQVPAATLSGMTLTVT